MGRLKVLVTSVQKELRYERTAVSSVESNTQPVARRFFQGSRVLIHPEAEVPPPKSEL